jgi:transposase-like protein
MSGFDRSGAMTMGIKRKGPAKGVLRAPRSPKAGRPPQGGAVPPRVRRRQKTAHASLRKDTMILQAAKGPRVLWGVTKPKVKKG